MNFAIVNFSRIKSRLILRTIHFLTLIFLDTINFQYQKLSRKKLNTNYFVPNANRGK